MNPLSALENLPAAIIGTLLAQLNRATGSKGSVNKADIPVVMRYVAHLACTSKTMAALVSDPIATDVFLKSLSDKYGNSREYFAAVLNTSGARKWLWQYIQEKGDAKIYQSIQDICELAANVLKEAKATLNFNLSIAHSRPDPSWHQTKQGFALYIDNQPKSLATPFGYIKIYDDAWGNQALSVAEVFIKRLDAVFEDAYKDAETVDIFEIDQVPTERDQLRAIDKKEYKKISGRELESKKETKNLIISNKCGNSSLYKIRAIKGIPVSDLLFYSPEDSRRSREAIEKIWEMLETHKLGKDPLAKEIKDKKTAIKTVDKPPFKNISEILDWSINFIVQLDQQPGLPTERNTLTKQLMLPAYDEALMIERLNAAAAPFLEKDSEWHMHAERDENLDNVIKLCIYPDLLRCSLDGLKTAYALVMESIRQNWVQSQLQHYPRILLTQSEEDYVLFVKTENTVHMETALIYFLANKLGVSPFIHCNDDWKKGEKTSGLYMWIKKEKTQETLAALNITPLASTQHEEKK